MVNNDRQKAPNEFLTYRKKIQKFSNCHLYLQKPSIAFNVNCKFQPQEGFFLKYFNIKKDFFLKYFNCTVLLVLNKLLYSSLKSSYLPSLKSLKKIFEMQVRGQFVGAECKWDWMKPT